MKCDYGKGKGNIKLQTKWKFFPFVFIEVSTQSTWVFIFPFAKRGSHSPTLTPESAEKYNISFTFEQPYGCIQLKHAQ